MENCALRNKIYFKIVALVMRPQARHTFGGDRKKASGAPETNPAAYDGTPSGSMSGV